MSSCRTCRLKLLENDDLVEAKLIDELTKEELIRAHLQWAPVRNEALTRLLDARLRVPEHWNWDWSNKAGKLDLLAYRCMGIEHGGCMQGLMMLSTLAVEGRLEGQVGKAVLYVEYIESAPWNNIELVEKPQFAGVGVSLLEAAIEFSEKEGFGGRIGLHSLRQAEPYYRKYMTDLGPDSGESELRYFEMSADQMHYFLEGRKR